MVFFFAKECGSLVGGSALHEINWKVGSFEVGYWGRTKFGGKGLITEGVRSLSEFALNELEASRVFLTTDEFNVASWRLAERAGYELEGTLRNHCLNPQGVLRVYSKIGPVKLGAFPDSSEV